MTLARFPEAEVAAHTRHVESPAQWERRSRIRGRKHVKEEVDEAR
jgi:hypothetical protein